VGRAEAGKRFEIRFISDGGDFEHLVEEEGFSLKKMEPRLTPEKIEYFAKVDRGEKLDPAMSSQELITRIENEVKYLQDLQPAAVITGSYLTIPVTCQILKIPLVSVIQSTWLEDFFKRGAGMTDQIKIMPFKRIADWIVWLFINIWIWYGFLNPLNKAARYFGIEGYKSMFDYGRGDVALVAEPAEFTSVKLPPGYYYTGPLIARQDFPIPELVKTISKNLPVVYISMGSSGTPEIVARILESFEGKPYRVIAPVKELLEKLPNVRIPSNVLVTNWLPALEVNKLADLSLIHGGIGTVMTAALAGKPVVGVGMQPEQVANLACLVRKGFAVRIPKSRDPSAGVQNAIRTLLQDAQTKQKAAEFSKIVRQWDGPKMAADVLYQRFGS
jgi:UDP:flavonoid glycosyltransferase YjiC (YdhE family)